ncbi:MAG TPA: HlyD family secretion protein [Chitinophagales bacterium]|nr:HlyD family secretion protein [Chitinophagales bacterium]
MAENNEKTSVKTIIFRVILGIALLVGGYFGVTKIMYALHHETTDNAQLEARFVPILPRVSGYIKKLDVVDYATVKKDSLLVEIDDTDLQLQLQEMEADLAQAQTDITNAQASIANSEAALAETKANLDVAQTRKAKAEQDYQRDQNLFRDGAITKKQLDDSKSNLDVVEKQAEASKNDVNVAQTRVGVIAAQLKKAQAIIDLKKVAIEQQKLKISYCKIYAPCDGKIGKRSIDEGQFVQAGSPLFTVVNDEDFWVVANYKETQLEHLKPGSEAEIVMDAYPDIKMKGKIASFSDATGAKFSLLPPDNATGNFVKVTQRVPIKIEFENAAQYKDKLRAGMNVFVSVPY